MKSIFAKLFFCSRGDQPKTRCACIRTNQQRNMESSQENMNMATSLKQLFLTFFSVLRRSLISVHSPIRRTCNNWPRRKSLEPCPLSEHVFDVRRLMYSLIKNCLQFSCIFIYSAFLSTDISASTTSPDFTEDELKFIAHSPTIHYSEVNWQPLSDIDSLPAYGGMIADYLTIILQQSGVRLEFVYAGPSWQDVLDKYNRHEIELIPALAKEDRIGRPFLYTDPYVVFPLVIVTRPDVDFISETGKLSGKKVGVGKGYSSFHFLKKNYPDIKLVETVDIQAGLKLLHDGAIDAFVDHLAVVSANINKSGYNLKIAGKTEFNFEHRIGIDPAYPELVSIINKILSKITNEEHNQIYNKWVRLQQESKKDYGPIFKILVITALTLITMGTITLLFVLNNKRLRNYQNKLAASQKILDEINAGLEDKVAQRTAELQLANESTMILLDEKKRSEFFAREMSNRNELILQSVSEGIFGVDGSGITTFVNTATERLLGYSADELIGKSIHLLIHKSINGNICPEEECVVSKSIKEGMRHEVNSNFCRKDGTCFPVQIVSAPLAKENDIFGAVIIFRDISDLLANEQRLIETNKFQAIGQLAAGVAHELNTPIQYIKNNVSFFGQAVHDVSLYLQCAQALCDQAEDMGPIQIREQLHLLKNNYDLDYLLDELPDAVNETTQGIEQIVNIVQSMKELSHPGKGQNTWTNLNRVIENAMMISKNEWKYVAELERDLDPNLPTFQCNPDSWIQMLINFILNSVHSIEERQLTNPAPGLIKIGTRWLDNQIELKILDNGTGVSEETKSQMFKPFYTTKKVGKGTGQGLAFASNLIEKVHKGTIQCDNRPEGGVVFEIRVSISVEE